jgi:hypothetical protein
MYRADFLVAYLKSIIKPNGRVVIFKYPAPSTVNYTFIDQTRFAVVANTDLM